MLARDADPWADPVLVLRAARAAAEHDLPIAPFTLERLAAESAPLAEPWPAEARDDFVALLGTGRPAVPVLEVARPGRAARPADPGMGRGALSRRSTTRCTASPSTGTCWRRPPQAAELDARRGAPGPAAHRRAAARHRQGLSRRDHSVAGADTAETIAHADGLSTADVATVTALVRHHLLLPDTATRRDLDDPMTITTVRRRGRRTRSSCSSCCTR